MKKLEKERKREKEDIQYNGSMINGFMIPVELYQNNESALKRKFNFMVFMIAV